MKISPPFWHSSISSLITSDFRHQVTSNTDNVPMFLYLSLIISIIYPQFIYREFTLKILHSSNVDESLIEGPLIGTGYGKIFPLYT